MPSSALRALAESGANLNATDPDGTTALLVAIINAHYDAAAVLLDMGADPNIGDVAGMTPLYAAVDMNTFPDTPGRPTPKPSGKLDAVDMVKSLLVARREPERHAERADPRAACTIAATARSATARRRSCAPRRRATSR